MSTEASVEAVNEALLYAQAHSLNMRVRVFTVKGGITISVNEFHKHGHAQDLDFAEAWSKYRADVERASGLKATWNAKGLYELFALASEKDVDLTFYADFSKHAGNPFKAEAVRLQPKVMNGKKLHTNAETAVMAALNEVAAL